MAILDIFKSNNDNAAATDTPSATDLLKQDHDKVRGLFKEVRNAGERAHKDKARLFAEIDTELSVHARIEEEIFYPAVKASRGEDAEKLVLEAQEEHAVVKRLLKELQGIGPEDETFDAKMKVLMEEVEHHADEEEDDMFPAAKKALGDDRLRELGARMQERKDQLLRSSSFLEGRGAARRSAPSTRKRASKPKAGSIKKTSPAKKRGVTKRAVSTRGSSPRVKASRGKASRRKSVRASASRGSAPRGSKKSSGGRSRTGRKGSRR